MEIECPRCGSRLGIDRSACGKRAICPLCQGEFAVPEMPPQTPLDVGFSTVDDGDSNPYAATLHGGEYRSRANYALPASFLLMFSLIGLMISVPFLISVLDAFGANLAGWSGFLLWNGLTVFTHTAALIGAIQMLRRRRLGLAKIGAIAALNPSTTCFVIQLPFAIWAVVVLFREQAEIDFDSESDGADFA